jgi:DNA mismatch repair protein MutL
MSIKILDQLTAEQIAAGEVIENPASVVKELVENSLDAGASKIDIEIEDGGKSYIAVTDNGRGIAAAELSLAFKRFATSKLALIGDLDNLSSLGFRGEALPSIAAVARVNLTTRADSALSGAIISLAGGEITEQAEIGAPPGTRVEVRNLFYNTPGRLKFLRADAAESSRISTLISELALAYPAVAFNLKSGKRNLFSSSGDGVLLHVIGSLYGNDSAEAMVELKREERDSGMQIYGYSSAPHFSRSSRRWITLVVNGRLIKNAMMLSALERAYGDLLPKQRHPQAALHLKMPADTIDVNVHPAKIEIRFQHPEEVKKLIYKTVRLALQGDTSLTQLTQNAANVNYLQNQEVFTQPSAWLDAATIHEREAPFKADQYAAEGITVAKDKPDADAHPSECRLIGQFLHSYLVAQRNDTLLIIDQHAAHERVIYHQLMTMGEDSKQGGASQLTIPLTVELPASWNERMPGLLPLLKETGFDLDMIGENSYAIRAVPFVFQKEISVTDLYDLLEEIINTGSGSRDSGYRETVLKTIACHRSVKAKQSLNHHEMVTLLKKWEQTPNAQYCPHGRPTVISFDRYQLDKGFQRRGGSK